MGYKKHAVDRFSIHKTQPVAAYAHLVSFEAEPEIAAATATVASDEPGVSDTEFRTIKLPLYREFSLENDAHFSSSFIEDILAPKLDIRHPLKATISNRTLFVLGYLGHTYFVGSNRDALEFNYFSELGLGLGLGKFALGVLGIYGDNVEGLSATFNYDY